MELDKEMEYKIIKEKTQKVTLTYKFWYLKDRKRKAR